jgi:hypothetical protein
MCSQILESATFWGLSSGQSHPTQFFPRLATLERKLNTNLGSYGGGKQAAHREEKA